MDDKELWEKAKWICVKESSCYAKDNSESVNPWEHQVTAQEQKAVLQKGEGLVLVRKCFTVDQIPASCDIRIAALGVYDLYCNGRRVGRIDSDGREIYDELKPGWTDFTKRVLYYTYDLTRYLQKGENCILVILSPGWWMGRISLNTYGVHDLALTAEILFRYGDGTERRITTDTDWLGTIGGPVLTADIWDGELYDARKDSYQMISKAAYAGLHWSPVLPYTEFEGVLSPHIGPTIQVRTQLERYPVTQTIYEGTDSDGSDFGHIHLIRSEEPYHGGCRLLKGQTLQYDMGQNMVGWVQFTVRGAAGTAVSLRFGEMCNDSGLLSRGNDGPKGSIYTANYRSAKAKCGYILKGHPDAETYHPAFTFYGFRYVELTADADIEIFALCGNVVGSATEETGCIETSHENVNRLISNILWGQRGNYLSIPTDCPQRDERLGWTGDTQIFVGAAAYNADVCGFFHKWLQDARDSQGPTGAYSDVIPRSRVVGEGNTAWGDAGIIVPYVIYKMYGDLDIIRECYASMEKYMAFLKEHQGPLLAYGDWLAYEPTDGKYISLAYYAYDAMLMREMSCAMETACNDAFYASKTKEYAALYQQLRNLFQERYLTPEGELTECSQTAYLLALKMKLLPDSCVETAKQHLLEKIRENGCRLSTGFIGTGIINQTLSEYGESNMAYSLLLQTECPSWLYSVLQGATTIWERWNSYTLETGFGDVAMNSFNHYAYGAVAEWMYRYMAGIEADANEPGFRHIILQPKPDLRTMEELPEGQVPINWVKASYRSRAGLIVSNWSTEDEMFVYEASVPEGTSATLYLPLVYPQGGISVNDVMHAVNEYPSENGTAVMHLAPGSYRFVQRAGRR